MKIKKMVAVVLVLTLVAAIQAGCSKGSNNTTDGVVTQKAAVTYPIKEAEGKKLTYWMPFHATVVKYVSSYNEHEIFQEISKRTGVTIEFIHPALGQEKEQLGVVMASGNLPDIIQIKNLYNGGSPAGVEDGVFLDLTKMIPVYAPDYNKAVMKSDMSYRLTTTNDGKITQFNIMKQTAPAFSRLNFREDMMLELGTKDTPVTIADYEALFEKMKAKGIVGFAPAASGRQDQFMWPYGITEGFFLGTDGKVKWGQGEAAYKEYLTLMNKWWNYGYIYKDFMGKLAVNDRRALWINKKVGMLPDSIDNASPIATTNKFVAIPANYPRLTPGQPIHFENLTYEALPITNAGATMATVVAKACKFPEIAVQYLNYYYTQEGADLCNWGIKDKAYTVDANGKKTFTDYMMKNEKVPLSDVHPLLKMHLIAKLAEPDVVCNPSVILSPESLALRMKYSDDKTIDNKQVLPDFQLSTEKSLERSEIMRDIETYSTEMTLKFITGAMPISHFENYIAQLKTMRIDEAIKITQEGYDIFIKKPGLQK